MSRRARGLACRQLVELVTDYFEDALEPAERARFQSHVAGCRGCQAYVAQMRTTVALLRATATVERPPGLARSLEAFRAWTRGSDYDCACNYLVHDGTTRAPEEPR
jgi:anti-sigma factor RsiW